jgi:flavin-binding protein dodecin
MATVKIIELIGTSAKSWHAAVEAALEEASKTLHGNQRPRCRQHDGHGE